MATQDELVWQAIGPSGDSFCSFKVKTVTQNFCKSPYNVSGLCSRQACPLANSRYATVREQEGALYLFVKTAERAHTPAKMWERVKLSSDYVKALEQIDSELVYWPSFLRHKCKQRTTKIVQYLIKMRKLRNIESGRLVPVKRKTERREKVREGKALAAARLEKNLEKELVARLKSRAYGDMPLNVNEDVWRAVLEREKLAAEAEGEEDLLLEEDEDDLDEEELEDEDLEEEEYEDEEADREFVEDFDESDVEDLEDYDDEEDAASDDESEEYDSDDSDAPKKGKGKRTVGGGPAQPPSKKQRPAAKKGPRVEVEYEMEGPARERALA